MKKKNLLVTAVAILGFTTISIAQTVPSYVPTNGLVGWWPFTGNAIDSSGNGNNGTVNAGQLTLDRNGNANSAYEFFTNSEYISGNAIGLNNQSFTVSLWVYIYGMASTTMNCFKFGGSAQSATDGGYRIAADGVGQTFGVQYATGTNAYSTLSFNNSLQQWHHVVGTLSSNQLRIYVDGVLDSSNIFSNNTIAFPLTSFYIGNNGNLNNGNLNQRKLDDIGIWNRALDSCEIKDLYFGSLGNCSSVGINEFSPNNLFSVYPNPVNSHINVKADAKLLGSVYTIYDNTGKLVLSGKINSTNTIIELDNLSGGIYLFSVGENMKQTFKIIKQ